MGDRHFYLFVSSPCDLLLFKKDPIHLRIMVFYTKGQIKAHSAYPRCLAVRPMAYSLTSKVDYGFLLPTFTQGVPSARRNALRSCLPGKVLSIPAVA